MCEARLRRGRYRVGGGQRRWQTEGDVLAEPQRVANERIWQVLLSAAISGHRLGSTRQTTCLEIRPCVSRPAGAVFPRRLGRRLPPIWQNLSTRRPGTKSGRDARGFCAEPCLADGRNAGDSERNWNAGWNAQPRQEGCHEYGTVEGGCKNSYTEVDRERQWRLAAL